MAICKRCIEESSPSPRETATPFISYCEIHWVNQFHSSPGQLSAVILKAAESKKKDPVIMKSEKEESSALIEKAFGFISPMYVHRNWLQEKWLVSDSSEEIVTPPEPGENWLCRLRLHVTASKTKTELFLVAMPLAKLKGDNHENKKEEVLQPTLFTLV